jgi:hypothetical protein
LVYDSAQEVDIDVPAGSDEAGTDFDHDSHR